ncbi:hypothetical protein ABFS83_10G134400 [Erythranthe nasuta]
MEKFSEIFGFLIILKETLKILPKNGKLTALIAILTLTLPSILFSLFIYFSQPLISYATASYTESLSIVRVLVYWALLLTLEIVFLVIYGTISHLSGIATILVSANSYTIGKNNLATKDLISSIRKIWRNPYTTTFRERRSNHSSSAQYLSVVLAFAIFLAWFIPNFVTISVAILVGIWLSALQLYLSVVWALSTVVSVLEYGGTRAAEVEKAKKLVEGGQRLHGFMLNLFTNVLSLIIFGGFWMFVGDRGLLQNLKVYGLFFLNLLSLFKIFVVPAYTVYYFQCKKFHGEEIVIGDFQYSELPTSLGNDIP